MSTPRLLRIVFVSNRCFVLSRLEFRRSLASQFEADLSSLLVAVRRRMSDTFANAEFLANGETGIHMSRGAPVACMEKVVRSLTSLPLVTLLLLPESLFPSQSARSVHRC